MGKVPQLLTFRALSNYFFNLDYANNGYSLEDPNYDLTVGAVSQQGGMPQGAYSTHADMGQGLAGKISHMHEENSPIVVRPIQASRSDHSWSRAPRATTASGIIRHDASNASQPTTRPVVPGAKGGSNRDPI